ncbi:hypothetical protein LLH03_13840 [bacterium]|nr:hypothetical protein [bacterium]
MARFMLHLVSALVLVVVVMIASGGGFGPSLEATRSVLRGDSPKTAKGVPVVSTWAGSLRQRGTLSSRPGRVSLRGTMRMSQLSARASRPGVSPWRYVSVQTGGMEFHLSVEGKDRGVPAYCTRGAMKYLGEMYLPPVVRGAILTVRCGIDSVDPGLWGITEPRADTIVICRGESDEVWTEFSLTCDDLPGNGPSGPHRYWISLGQRQWSGVSYRHEVGGLWTPSVTEPDHAVVTFCQVPGAAGQDLGAVTLCADGRPVPLDGVWVGDYRGVIEGAGNALICRVPTADEWQAKADAVQRLAALERH